MNDQYSKSDKAKLDAIRKKSKAAQKKKKSEPSGYILCRFCSSKISVSDTKCPYCLREKSKRPRKKATYLRHNTPPDSKGLFHGWTSPTQWAFAIGILALFILPMYLFSLKAKPGDSFNHPVTGEKLTYVGKGEERERLNKSNTQEIVDALEDYSSSRGGRSSECEIADKQYQNALNYYNDKENKTTADTVLLFSLAGDADDKCGDR